MLTYQDYEAAAAENRLAAFLCGAIAEHKRSEAYLTAVNADLYDHRKNVTINTYTRVIQQNTRNPLVDITAANNRIASNFFHRLNTQRCAYSLGNGVSFTIKEERRSRRGLPIQVDVTKERLGQKFDTDLYRWAYRALIHGVAFGFWNLDRLYVFPLTEFVPLWDENTGALRAGIRFWQLDEKRPMTAVLYTEAGYATWRADAGASDLQEIEPMRPYVLRVAGTPAGGEVVVGAENYGALPVVPMWGNSLRQSTLIGLREQIDSYDLIQSGFANDLHDCAQIYWIIQNCGGMTDEDLQNFLNNLRINHIATADTGSFDGNARTALEPYTQDVPHVARNTFLQGMRAAIYEGFGALDVHSIYASSTNDHIDAAYQPMDEEADDFEYQIIEAVQQLLKLQGIEDTPVFKRNRVSNIKETIEAIMLEAPVLGQRKTLEKLPNVTVDEVEEIMLDEYANARARLSYEPTGGDANDGGGSGADGVI